MYQSCTRVGSGPAIHPRVGLGPDLSLLSGLGRVGSNCVRLCRSPWVIQNVTLNFVNNASLLMIIVRVQLLFLS